jgi:two-component SAPR family response regulator
MNDHKKSGDKRGPLEGMQILIVEDEYLLADDLRRTVGRLGASVLGPAPSVEGARSLLDSQRCDFALLDVNLNGDTVFPIADSLEIQGIPYLFVTGYESWTMPYRFPPDRRLGKPVTADALLRAISEQRQQREAIRS